MFIYILTIIKKKKKDGTKGELLNKHSMVELQCLSGEEGFVAAAEYLNTYAEYLYPFVELIKFDHRLLTAENSNTPTTNVNVVGGYNR